MSKNKAAGLLSTQFVTALISTSLVLVLLGTIVLFVLTARNLSNYVKENINVTILLNDDISQGEIESLQKSLEEQQYVKSLKYISKERALHEQCVDMGTDPSEFLGYNPFTASFEIKLKSEYANNQSLDQIAKQLKATKKVMDVIYQKELMNAVNNNIQKFSIILLIIAALFTYISFALINNTVRLTIFSRRFIINTMKLVGASWSFIRWPFIRQAVGLGLLSGIIALIVLGAGVYFLFQYEPDVYYVITWRVMLFTAIAVVVFGVLITTVCSWLSVNKFLRMKAGELYRF